VREDDNVDDTQKAGPQNRWWEYYFVRYFLGTIAGAIIILFLAKSSSSMLYNSGLTGLEDISDLTVSEITGFAAVGFAFCYIASTPMLLWHATRAHLGLNPLRFRWIFWLITVASILALYLVVAGWLSVPKLSSQGQSLLLFLFIVGAQVATVIAAHCNRFKSITSFYANLARDRADQNPVVGGYVESYRHLREHGNAVSILVLEFALAFILFFAPRRAFAFLAIPIWILPSTYSWFVASLLESNLGSVAKK
jgi:hypothetical protein